MTPRDPYRGTYSEDALIERPAVKLFASLGWQTINAYDEVFGAEGTLGRGTDQEVVLVRELRRALKRLNRDASDDAITDAVEQMTRDRSMMSAARANQDVWKLLTEGARVKAHDDERDEEIVTIQFIDWAEPEANDFLLVEQLWVFGEMYRRRCDLVGFVNGIPLVFLELKASHRRPQTAYDDNLTDYRDTIPQIFWWNGFIVLSNGSATRVGSTTASWEHFAEWKRINDEGETGVVSLETTIRGTCDKAKLLDLVRNFTVFQEAKGGIIKKVAKNHQFLGVNRAIQSVGEIQANRGRLGVFWHTQGSGKSLSMIFFAQKILRTVPGNWTFVIVTDREELDEQIYKDVRIRRRDHGEGSARRKRRTPPPAASRQSPLRLHPDPEVSDRQRNTLPEALRSLRHHRHHRRSAPQPVRHLRIQHAPSAARTPLSSASRVRR